MSAPDEPGAPCERCHLGTPEADLVLFDGEWWCDSCANAVDAERGAASPADDADDDEPREPEPIDEDEMLEEGA